MSHYGIPKPLLDDNIDACPTRGEITTQARKNARHTLRNQKLPVLTARDVRRYRKSYAEAMLLELSEDGFEESSLLARNLMALDEQIREDAGPESPEWMRPRLKDQLDFLQKLRAGFVMAETARAGDEACECAAFLQLGIFFLRRSADWWWLAEQMLLQAVGAGVRYQQDGGRRQAIARHVYGSFLLHQLKHSEEAVHQLEQARELSAGRKWEASPDMGTELRSVFTETTLLLHEAMMDLVRGLQATDPRKAARLAKVALRRVRGIRWPLQEAEALLELAAAQEACGEPSRAIFTLQDLWAMDKKAGRDGAKRRCGGLLVAALCSLRLSRYSEILSYLEKYQHEAEKYDLKDLIATGHRYLGEYHLMMGHNSEASTHFLSAFTMFYEEGSQPVETERSRALLGVAVAEEHYSEMVELLTSMNKLPNNVYRLAGWKDMRSPFANQNNPLIGSKYDITAQGESSRLPNAKVMAMKFMSMSLHSVIAPIYVNMRNAAGSTDDLPQNTASAQQNSAV